MSGEAVDYGLGITVDHFKGVTRWSHTGSSGGYRSFLVYFPEYQRELSYMTNTSSNGAPIFRLIEAFFADLLDDRPPRTRAREQTEEGLIEIVAPEQYTGRYLSDELGTIYEIQEYSQGLSLFHPWMRFERLDYIGDDTFTFGRGNGILIFERDEDDEILSFSLAHGRTKGIKFLKAFIP